MPLRAEGLRGKNPKFAFLRSLYSHLAQLLPVTLGSSSTVSRFKLSNFLPDTLLIFWNTKSLKFQLIYTGWKCTGWKFLVGGSDINFIKIFLYQVPPTCQMLSLILANVPKSVGISVFLRGTEDTKIPVLPSG